MITKSKVTEIFCVADDFCKEFDAEMAKKRCSINTGCPKTLSQAQDVGHRGHHNPHLFPLQFLLQYQALS